MTSRLMSFALMCVMPAAEAQVHEQRGEGLAQEALALVWRWQGQQQQAGERGGDGVRTLAPLLGWSLRQGRWT